MKHVIASIVLMIASSASLWADDAPACFGVSFSDDHMAANPHQYLRDISVRMTTANGVEGYDLRMQFRGIIREITATAMCFESERGYVCAIECEGGIVIPSMDDGRLRLEIDYRRAETSPLEGEDVAECMNETTPITADDDDAGLDLPATFFLDPRDPRDCHWEVDEDDQP